MKLLVDSSVWSLSLRRKNKPPSNPVEQRKVALLSEAIADGRVAMIGPVRQELLSGIKEQAQYEALKRHLRDYRDEPLQTEDYEHAARFYNLCRSDGVECGPIDILICSVAIRRGWEILTTDSGLVRCLEVLEPERQAKGRH
ncbi:MAG: PIN domain-containing protein [Terracidiphilus sp.]